MSKIDHIYHEGLRKILEEGVLYPDPNRKGVNRLEIPRFSFYHSFEDGFPAITTKQLYWKGVVGENIWILRGDTNIKYLIDNNIHIWDPDAYNYFLKGKPTITKCTSPDNCRQIPFEIDNENHLNLFLGEVLSGNNKVGDLGYVYGHQLRKFGAIKMDNQIYKGFDQLKWIVNEMKNNPLSTKKDVTYINPCDKDNQALSPCHTGWSIIMRKDLSGFDLEFKMSSWDYFLGGPFNIAGYAFDAKILENLTGYKALGIYCTAHNVHIYEPHIEAAKEQLSRDVDKYSNFELGTTTDFETALEQYHLNNDLDQFLNSIEIKDFKIFNDGSYPRIPAKMIPYIK